MRIAVLLHERDGDFWTGDYLLKHLAKEWQGAGVSVLPVFGPKGFVSADAAILHVDLTRIPEPYLELAGRYRRTVNGRVVDIGKRAFSAHIVRPGDGYEGPVIVKTERNYGGRPEARFAARRSVWARAVGHAKRACELTRWQDPGPIDTLAAAHAAAGDFDRAVEFQEKALALPDHEYSDAKGGRQRRLLYTQKRPYR